MRAFKRHRPIAVIPLTAWPEATDNGGATILLWHVWQVPWVQMNTSIKMTTDWRLLLLQMGFTSISQRRHFSHSCYSCKRRSGHWFRWRMTLVLRETTTSSKVGKPQRSWHTSRLTALTEATLRDVGGEQQATSSHSASAAPVLPIALLFGLCSISTATTCSSLSLPSSCLQPSVIVPSFTLSFYALTWTLSLCLFSGFCLYSSSPLGRLRRTSTPGCSRRYSAELSESLIMRPGMLLVHSCSCTVHRWRRDKISTVHTMLWVKKWLMTCDTWHHDSSCHYLHCLLFYHELWCNNWKRVYSLCGVKRQY